MISLVTFLLLLMQVLEIFGISCEDRNITKCYCSSSNNLVKYTCPNVFKQELELEIRQGDSIRVTCLNGTLFSFLNVPMQDQITTVHYFPKLSLGAVKKLYFKDCNIFHNLSSTLETLGIKSVKHLEFSICPDPFNCPLSNVVLKKEDLASVRDLIELELRHVPIRNIEEDALVGFDDLLILNIDTNALAHIPPIFSNTPKLRKLQIFNSELSELSDLTFQNLTNLTTLLLFNNAISKLDVDVFAWTPKLETLDLMNNKIDDIPANIFAHTPMLVSLNLEKNRLASLPPMLFAETKQLVNLRLGMNTLESLHPDTFANLTRLKKLGLSYNNLTSLPVDVFRDLTNLEYLEIINNYLSNIEDGTLRNLRNLKSLHLSKNKLTELTPSIFKGLDNLNELMLAFNSLDALADSPLSNLKKLEQLSLKRNQISYIHKYAFASTQRLKFLDLSYNKITNLGNSYGLITPFNNLLHIENLNLRGNQLSKTFNEMVLRPSLKKINLAENNFTDIELQNLLGINNLEIDFSNNKITTVRFPSFTLRNNETQQSVIYLSNNPINCDCHAYDLVNYFKKGTSNTYDRFKLKYENLLCSNNSRFKNEDVSHVPLSDLYCELSDDDYGYKCARWVYPWNNTLVVNCTNRNLTVVPAVPPFRSFIFDQMFAVNKYEVHLENNNIENFSNEIGYTNVSYLYLQNNIIKNVSWIPQNVKILQLHSNKLEMLDSNIVTNLEQSTTLQELSLQDNPWICECSTVNFSITLRESLIDKLMILNMTCANNDLKLLEVTENELCSVHMSVVVILGSTLLLFLLGLLVCVVLYYKYEQEIKVWLFAHKLFLWFITEEEVDKDKKYDAFISYAHQDERFVVKHIVSELEKCGYKLCIHIRNFMPGDSILDQIIQSVEESRRTIIILSPSFLKSNWTRLEFRTAHTQGMLEGRTRVIPILYDNVDTNDVGDELNAYFKTNTYVKWGDPWFWQKLRYAMPHRIEEKIKFSKSKNKRIDNVMVAIDKLDLMNMPATPNMDTPPSVSDDPLLIKGHPLDFKIDKDSTTTPSA